MIKIGERIRELRKKRGLSQGDIERVTGMLKAYVSRVEHGHTVPSLESLERFSSALGIELHEIFRQSTENAEPVTENQNAFLTLLARYIHNMRAEEREVLMRLACRFAKGDGSD